MTISGGTFTTMGKTYQAKSINFNLEDGVATIVVSFPFTSEYENSSMTLNINGADVNFDLEDLFSKCRVQQQ